MSQVFGYLCSDKSLTAAVMEEHGAPLRGEVERERGALGIGWLQDGRSLLRRYPRTQAKTVDVPGLLSDVPTRAILGQVRHRDEGKAQANDLQPFRFRNWVFSQRGAPSLRDDTVARLRDELPDHAARNMQGTSIAELAFHLFYVAVEGEYSTTPEHLHTDLYLAKLKETAQRLEDLAGEDGQESWQIVVATERFMAAVALGEPIGYRLVEGIEVLAEKPLFAGHKPKRIRHDKFRALLVTSGPEEPPTGWARSGVREVVWTDGDWELKTSQV